MDESIFRDLATTTDGVVVAVSRGKDSLVCLDLARKHFKRVEAYCMHLVPGLSFVEDYLDYLERRYSITIDRVPHWFVSRMLRHGTFRPLARSVPLETTRKIRERQKRRTGIPWIVSGEKARDGLGRRGMLAGIRKLGRPGVDAKSGVCYPLADWSDSQVYNHLKKIVLPLPGDYRVMGHSHCVALTPEWLHAIKTHFPEDYALVERAFPFCGAALVRYEREAEELAAAEEAAPRKPKPVKRGRGTDLRAAAAAAQEAALRRADAAEGVDQPGGLQPAHD